MDNIQAFALNQPWLPLPPDNSGMADWAQRNPNATTARFDSWTINGLTYLANARGTLVSLVLRYASNIDGEGLSNLMQQCERLTVVKITDCQMITQQVRAVLRDRFPHITGL